MSLPRKPLVVLAGLLLVVMVLVLISKRSRATAGPPLPSGKVEPYFTGDLLHAPNGTLWRVGYSPVGGTASMTFTPFAAGNDWAVVSGGFRNGMAIKEDGTLWWWSSRYPGPGYATITDPPAQVGTDRDWVQVRFGWNCAVLLKKDGSLWFLGGTFRNSNMGLEPLTPHMQPVQVGGDYDWATVETCGILHYALKHDGSLWYWGNIVYRGPYEQTPLRCSEDYNWAKITTGSFWMLALKRDGSLWLHGLNSHVVSQALHSAVPIGLARIGRDSDWVDAVAGHLNFVARKPDGSWWACGENHYAQLGLPHWFGHSKHVTEPTRVPLELDVWTWHIAENTTAILTRDGSFYFMGKRPGGSRRTSLITRVQETINRTSYRIPGMPALFARPGEEWSQQPVRMGELPKSAVAP